jgi:NAD(P)H-nitrite reductase large subunit
VRLFQGERNGDPHRGRRRATLAALQKDLKCGTNCGSCVPELRRLAAA